MKGRELLETAKEFGVTDLANVTAKQDVILRILQGQTEAQGNIFAQGIIETASDSYAAAASSLRPRTCTSPPARCGASASGPATS